MSVKIVEWESVKLSLAGAATSIIFVATKDVFCRDKSKLVWTKLLSRKSYVCRDKYLSWEKFCHDKNILLQQNFSRDKHTFFATNTCMSCLSRQIYILDLPPPPSLSLGSPLFLLHYLPLFLSDIGRASARVAFHIHSPSPQIWFLISPRSSRWIPTDLKQRTRPVGLTTYPSMEPSTLNSASTECCQV